jgi:hypothetical protein
MERVNSPLRVKFRPIAHKECVTGDLASASDVPANELLEGGIEERAAALAAQHVALVTRVEQDGLALALRSLGEGRFDDQTRELLGVLHRKTKRSTTQRLSISR